MNTFAGQSVEAARRALAARLKASCIESAELEARTLVGAALGLDLTGLVASATRLLGSVEADRLDDFTRRRLAGEPVARILGKKEFWGVSFKLSEATLVPRPDTETVVEQALEILRASPISAVRIADIGTGSGAILLALLLELPLAFGIGTDLSEGALGIAQENASQLGLGGRAAFVACNYAAALSGGFDLIVSNPPYVRSADIARLAVEVRVHDPLLALDGGTDGLEAYRTLIPDAAGLLKPGGALVVEAGRGQAGDVGALMAAAGLMAPWAPKTDLAGIPRAVTGRKMLV